MHKIKIRRLELGLKIKDVVDLSGIAYTSISRIEAQNPNGFKTSFDVAIEIAKALDTPVHTLFESMELSNLGRPAKSGAPITNLSSKRIEKPCPGCRIMLPSNGKCNSNECEKAIAS